MTRSNGPFFGGQSKLGVGEAVWGFPKAFTAVWIGMFGDLVLKKDHGNGRHSLTLHTAAIDTACHYSKRRSLSYTLGAEASEYLLASYSVHRSSSKQQ